MFHTRFSIKLELNQMKLRESLLVSPRRGSDETYARHACSLIPDGTIRSTSQKSINSRTSLLLEEDPSSIPPKKDFLAAHMSILYLTRWL